MVNPYLPPDPHDPINRISDIKMEAGMLVMQGFGTNMADNLQWKLESIEGWETMALVASESHDPRNKVIILRCVQRCDHLLQRIKVDLKNITTMRVRLLHGRGTPWWGNGDFRDVWVPEGMPLSAPYSYHSHMCVWTTRESVEKAEGIELDNAFGPGYRPADITAFINELPAITIPWGGRMTRVYNTSGGWVTRDIEE